MGDDIVVGISFCSVKKGITWLDGGWVGVVESEKNINNNVVPSNTFHISSMINQ